MLVLDAHDTTTPVSAKFVVVVELLTEVSRKSLQVLNILSVYFSKGNSSCSLHVNKFSQICLATNKGIRNIFTSAKCWQVNNSFNWINIVSNNYKLGFAFFYQSGDVVQSKLDVDWLSSLSSSAVFGFLLKTKLFLLLGLWLVFSKKLK